MIVAPNLRVRRAVPAPFAARLSIVILRMIASAIQPRKDPVSARTMNFAHKFRSVPTVRNVDLGLSARLEHAVDPKASACLSAVLIPPDLRGARGAMLERDLRPQVANPPK